MKDWAKWDLTSFLRLVWVQESSSSNAKILPFEFYFHFCFRQHLLSECRSCGPYCRCRHRFKFEKSNIFFHYNLFFISSFIVFISFHRMRSLSSRRSYSVSSACCRVTNMSSGLTAPFCQFRNLTVHSHDSFFRAFNGSHMLPSLGEERSQLLLQYLPSKFELCVSVRIEKVHHVYDSFLFWNGTSRRFLIEIVHPSGFWKRFWTIIVVLFCNHFFFRQLRVLRWH